MKPVYFIPLLLFFFNATTANAQKLFTISGKVTDAKGANLPAATVFLDGSQKKTVTDENGAFSFPAIPSGTYRLIVHFVGFNPSNKTVIVQDQSAIAQVTMQQKLNMLREVVIGNNKARTKFMKIFIKNFLGESDNAKSCKILNPEIIDFSTKSTFIEATTDDFLNIENANLGYRIKYLLRNFKFNNASLIASYDGECIFEAMNGSATQQDKWKENRKATYHGSLMHYLRALFKDKLTEEGFLTYLTSDTKSPFIDIAPQPVTASQITKHIDSIFMVFRFPGRLYTLYNSKKEENSSTLQLFADEAVVDEKGSYIDYKSFLIQGYWGRKRIGDQLPFEYDPESE